jgi:hypothetical protein
MVFTPACAAGDARIQLTCRAAQLFETSRWGLMPGLKRGGELSAA